MGMCMNIGISVSMIMCMNIGISVSMIMCMNIGISVRMIMGTCMCKCMMVSSKVE